MGISHANASEFFSTVKARKLHHLSCKNNQCCQKRLLTAIENVTCGQSCKKREMLHDPEMFIQNLHNLFYKISPKMGV